MDIGPAKAPLHAEQTVVSRSLPLRAREHDAPTGHVVAQPTAHAAITAQRADLGERALSPWRWRVSYCQRIGWADGLAHAAKLTRAVLHGAIRSEADVRLLAASEDANGGDPIQPIAGPDTSPAADAGIVVTRMNGLDSSTAPELGIRGGALAP